MRERDLEGAGRERPKERESVRDRERERGKKKEIEREGERGKERASEREGERERVRKRHMVKISNIDMVRKYQNKNKKL